MVSENVDDGEDGLIVKDNTGKGLYEKINTMLMDQVAAKRMGEQCI